MKTQPIPVTADNFNRAESDMYVAGIVQTEGPSASLIIIANSYR